MIVPPRGRWLVLILEIVFSGMAYSQVRKKVDLNKVPIDDYAFQLRRAHEKINLDGTPDEAVWQVADSLTDFYANYPFDTGYAVCKTVVRMMYNDRFLYLSAVCYNSKIGKNITQTMGRDWSVRDTDGLQFVIDPFNDKTNGFGFGISPYNAQRDGLVTNGGNDGVTTAWDNKWYSETQILEDRWTCEIAIPFSTLRFKPGLKEWRINFCRIDYKQNEMSTWVPLFRNFSVANLGYAGRMIWDEPIEKKGPSFSLIPYLTGQLDQNWPNATRNDLPATHSEKMKFNAGLEAKVPVSNSLNLDLAMNPDFSQVDVDRQITNLTRFELFFPERRNFFLENADLFDLFGGASVRPFFSRRIGIVRNPTTGLYELNPILFGARLTGKPSQNWRIGALNAATPNNEGLGQKGQNYTMLAFQRQLFKRNNFGAFLVNRQATGTASHYNLQADNQDFNRVFGFDYTQLSLDNRFSGKYFYHQSMGPNNRPQSYAYQASQSYSDRHWFINSSVQVVGSNYNPEVGFLPRRGFARTDQFIGYTFLPQGSQITGHGPSFSMSTFWNHGLGLGDEQLSLSYSLGFKNTSYLRFGVSRSYVRLFRPFDPSGRGGRGEFALDSGNGYAVRDYFMSYSSDIRKKFFFTFSATGGGHWNGNIMSLAGTLNARWIPFALFTFNWSYDKLYLPKPWGNSELLLLGPSANITLTNNLFFRVFYQYNQQANNINLNARLQWRFKPVSDLFLVYTDNYVADNYRVKNRAVVIKLTYWFNT